MKKVIAVFSALLLSATLATASAQASPPPNTNETAYWLGQYPNSVACYKYDPPGQSNPHGSLAASNTAVVLNAYSSDWQGDRWEVLIVKGGPQGDAVYVLPNSGEQYFTPGVNSAGNKYEVSHWIVCLGQTPSSDPDPSPSPSPSPSPDPDPDPTDPPDDTIVLGSRSNTETTVEDCTGLVTEVTTTEQFIDGQWVVVSVTTESYYDPSRQTCVLAESG